MDAPLLTRRLFLHAGSLAVEQGDYEVTTVLGSCVSTCLWDPVLRIGGINHYLLPLWNGEGLSSPKYGNIAITKLIEKMLMQGARKKHIVAKIFGGAGMMQNANGLTDIGGRNVEIAKDMLADERIPILGSDTGGSAGRKIIFNMETGSVLVKRFAPR